MIRNYAFKVKIVSSHGNYFLEIKPHTGTSGQVTKRMDPIYFSELNVPIRQRTPQHYLEAGWEPEYFLDFENSFNGSGDFCNCFKRDNQMRILGILEQQACQDIADFLSGNEKTQLVKGKTVKFQADDGLSLSYSGRSSGSPKKAGKSNGAKTAKFLRN